MAREANDGVDLRNEEVLAEAERDLGFGTVVTGHSRQRLLNPDGTFNVHRTGLPFLNSLNPYHTLLSMSWPQFLGLLLVLYFVSNVFFGVIYAAFGEAGIVDTVGSTPENILIRGFFFSVQTFATIGYGNIHPVGVMPNLVVTLESYYSLIVNALITGIAFARFAKPTARIIFSEVAVIAPYRDSEGLMFRLVNGRNNQLINVRLQVLFARFVNEDGRMVRRFDQLTLERNSVTFFPLSWTVVHPIDQTSPLWSLEQEDYIRADGELLIL